MPVNSYPNNYQARLLTAVFGLVMMTMLLGVTGVQQDSWIKHEFKVVVDHSAKECFYQTITLHSMLHVSYQLTNGDDIYFTLKDPHGVELKSSWLYVDAHQISNVTTPGDYEICLDNTYSFMTSKTVSVYLLAYHAEHLQKTATNAVASAQFIETADVATEMSGRIGASLFEISSYQMLASFRQLHDEYLVEANYSLVLHWSLFQCAFIMLCACIQVYVLKRLFSVPASSRPRC